MRTKLVKLQQNIKREIIGQEELIKDLLTALICGGHVLLEGMPGLAKTKISQTLAESINGEFKRVQFTPDLLPSDLTGTNIYIEKTSKFEFREGPLFANIILADEINRAPAKVQSALLEAMSEGQITVGNKTHKLPSLFFVIATQNPIEQAGTYPLPEAQLDRFLFHLKLDYPSKKEEIDILNLSEKKANNKKPLPFIISPEKLIDLRNKASKTYIDKRLKQYIVDIVDGTRNADSYDKKLASFIKHGVSPRASISLLQTAKARAYLEGEECVLPHHIQEMAVKILRHRIILNYQAEAESLTTDHIIERLLKLVKL